MPKEIARPLAAGPAGQIPAVSNPARAPQPQPGFVAVTKDVPSLPTAAIARRVGPSFDCSRARSPSERIICTDVELGQLDRQLSQVYAQAKKSVTDRAAFRRERDPE